MKKTFIIMALLCTALSFCSCTKKLPKKNLTIIRSDKSTEIIEAEIADSNETREHGYMERKNIPDGTGMLFVFEYDQVLAFWMKNTPHPLSIAYIDYKGQIRDIFDMTPYSLSPIKSTVSVRYALEVPQGWFERENIHEGDFLVIDFKE